MNKKVTSILILIVAAFCSAGFMEGDKAPTSQSQEQAQREGEREMLNLTETLNNLVEEGRHAEAAAVEEEIEKIRHEFERQMVAAEIDALKEQIKVLERERDHAARVRDLEEVEEIEGEMERLAMHAKIIDLHRAGQHAEAERLERKLHRVELERELCELEEAECEEEFEFYDNPHDRQIDREE